MIRKNYPFIEGRSNRNFRVVNLFTDFIFTTILFCIDVIRFTGMGIIVVRSPWVKCELFAELSLVLIL